MKTNMLQMQTDEQKKKHKEILEKTHKPKRKKRIKTCISFRTKVAEALDKLKEAYDINKNDYIESMIKKDLIKRELLDKDYLSIK